MSNIETKCLHAGYEQADATTKAHAVPLSTQTITLLEIMRPISGRGEFVFPSDRKPKTAYLKRDESPFAYPSNLCVLYELSE